ncbi:ABC transporter permease [Kitasatospora sp. SUK 42]|uniref:ABC transporter permease n=1 Tax=Kitasatospora sp. SUK 42 TaxID=1588882 RepID=UPI0018C97466|nr:ABC transporter permease [Kitasatospora sp. SUK 42]MBV2153694.1 ABC transporter permease [Kitasatospora sp. SUK 42]
MSASTSVPSGRRALVSPLALGFVRGAGEIRVHLRDLQAVGFGLVLPVGLMLLFGTLFKGEVDGTSVQVRDVIVAGVCASAIMSVAFGSLGVAIASDLSDGTVRRLMSTPFPLASYVLGKLLLAGVLAVLGVSAVLAAAVLRFGFRLPTDPARWATFAWVFALGLGATCLLGILVGSLVADPKKSGGLIQLPYIFLQFVSGVYYAFGGLPAGLQQVAALFPLKWMAQGMRSALLPNSYTTAEVAGTWESGRTALVLSAWIVILAPLCVWSVRRRVLRDR